MTAIRQVPWLMVRARRYWLPWTLVILAAVTSVADIVVSAQNDRTSGTRLDAPGWLIRGDLWVLPVMFSVVGAVIVMRRPGNRIGRLMIAVGLGEGVATLMSDYPLEADRATRPLFSLSAWIGGWDWTLVPALLWLLVLLFPTGRLPSPRWRPMVWIGLAGWGGATLLSAVRTGHVGTSGVENPFGIVAMPETIVSLFGLCGAAVLPSAVLALVLRFRWAEGSMREQLKWFTYGSAVAIMLTTAAFLTNWSNTPVVLLAVTAVTALPLFIGIAIVRYRLYDIDLIINRTLVYGGLSVGVVALYVGVVGYFTALLHIHNTAIPSLLVTALVALAFQPARVWLQGRVNRLLYGDRDAPYQVLARLGERFADAVEPTAVLPTLVHTVADSLKLPYVAIAIAGQEVLDDGAAVGTPTGEVIAFPLVHQGERVGELLVSPRRGEPALSSADRNLLEHLAQRAGVAIHSVRLTRHLQRLSEDLQRSRERLVLAQEDERSRLRNDLHDGLAPKLAGLALAAGTIAELVRHDPERAVRQARQLEGSMRDSVGEIRRLVYDLRPPTLDDLGLLAAIEEGAGQFGSIRAQGRGLEVRTALPDSLPPLPAAVEVAVYRIVQEALMNVERHAHARCCVIALHAADTLRLEISDDGIGLPAGSQPGVGLHSMRERAEELGGQFAIDSTEAQGTRLLVSFPLPAGTPA